MTKEVRHRKSSSTDSKLSHDRASGSLHSHTSCTPGRDITTDYGFKYNGKNGKNEEMNLKPII